MTSNCATDSSEWFGVVYGEACPLPHHRQWILQHPLERAEELRASGAVDDAVVAGHGDLHPLPDLEALGGRHRLLADASNGQDAGLGRIGDGGKLVNVEHAKVRH